MIADSVAPRWKRDRAARTRALIDAARAVFAEAGYDAAATKEIARRAGCAEGLIHRYFGGKRGLLRAVVVSGRRNVNEELRGFPASADLLEELEQIAVWLVMRIWEARELTRIVFSQSLLRDDLAEIDSTNHQEFIAAATERLRQHQKAGNIAQGVDLEAVAYGLHGASVYFGLYCLIILGSDLDDVVRLAKANARVVARGLAPTRYGASQNNGMP